MFIRSVAMQSSSTTAITIANRRQYEITDTFEPKPSTTSTATTTTNSASSKLNSHSSHNRVRNFFQYQSSMFSGNKSNRRYSYDPVVMNPVSTTTPNAKNPSKLASSMLQRPSVDESKEEIKVDIIASTPTTPTSTIIINAKEEDFVKEWLSPSKRRSNTMIYQEDGADGGGIGGDVESHSSNSSGSRGSSDKSSSGSMKRRVSV